MHGVQLSVGLPGVAEQVNGVRDGMPEERCEQLQAAAEAQEEAPQPDQEEAPQLLVQELTDRQLLDSLSKMQQELQVISRDHKVSQDMIQAERRILENLEQQKRSAGQRAVIQRETVRV